MNHTLSCLCLLFLGEDFSEAMWGSWALHSHCKSAGTGSQILISVSKISLLIRDGVDWERLLGQLVLFYIAQLALVTGVS